MSEPCTLTPGKPFFSNIMQSATVDIVVSSMGPDLILVMGSFLLRWLGTSFT